MNLAQAEQPSRATVDFVGEGEFLGLPFSSAGNAGFSQFITNLLSGILIIAFLLLLLYLLWAGIEWITAGGDSGKVGKARDKIVQSVVGMLVLASSVAIVIMMQRFLGVDGILFNGTGSNTSRNGSGGNGGGTSGCSAATAGQKVSDGGAGGYCTGSAQVQCNGPDHHLSYYHYDPIRCLSGEPNCNYEFIDEDDCS